MSKIDQVSTMPSVRFQKPHGHRGNREFQVSVPGQRVAQSVGRERSERAQTPGALDRRARRPQRRQFPLSIAHAISAGKPRQ